MCTGAWLTFATIASSSTHSLHVRDNKNNLNADGNVCVPFVSRRQEIHLWLFASLNSYCFEFMKFFVSFSFDSKNIDFFFSSLLHHHLRIYIYAAAFRMVYFHLRPFNLKHLQSNNKTRQHMRIIYAHANQSEVVANSGSFVYIC